MIPYTLIRSSRRTLSLQIWRDGTVIARAPLRLSMQTIEGFIRKKESWIQKHTLKEQEHPQKHIYKSQEIGEMKRMLSQYLIPRVQFLWSETNFPKYTSIKITKSEQRWGSCNSKNWLCFSYRLAEYIDKNTRFIDAIIIHELAHLREKNHQKPFWNLVYALMPEYDTTINSYKLLKEL